MSELYQLRAEIHILKMQHRNDLANAWDAGFMDKHLGTHDRDDNPYREGM